MNIKEAYEMGFQAGYALSKAEGRPQVAPSTEGAGVKAKKKRNGYRAKPWSEADETFLTSNSEMTILELARILNRTKSAVYVKRLELKKKANRPVPVTVM